MPTAPSETINGNESKPDGVLVVDPLPRKAGQPVSTSVTSTSPTSVEQADSTWTPPTWEEIVEQHSARVYRLAYRLTGNPHDAEDLTHDVFVRVFKSLHSYQPGTFEGWLHRITTNVFLDKMRRKQRIRFDSLPDDAAGRLPSLDKGPEQTYTTPVSTTTCSEPSTRSRRS